MKIISKILIVFILGLILFLSYLSLIGFETKKFNETIIKNVKNINSNLNLELKEIKIILNLFEGKLNAKTIGSKLSSENKSIEIESIKTQIPLRSLFKEKFLIDNMEISTRSLNIKDLISFIRIFNKDPELYILNKIIKKGFLIADIKLDFDEKGKIKNNYKINGIMRDAKIDILKNYNIEKLNFGFNYNENELKLFDTNLSLNNSKLFSKNLKFTKIDENFLVNGEMETRDLELENKNIELFIKFYFPYLKVDKLKFSSKNDFTFKINNKYQFKDLSIKSDIELKEFSFLNNDKLSIFFPKINENIKLSNHKLNVNYEKKTLTINGSGDILLQNNKDQLTMDPHYCATTAPGWYHGLGQPFPDALGLTSQPVPQTYSLN